MEPEVAIRKLHILEAKLGEFLTELPELCDVCEAALRAQQEAEKNEPLTLNELRQMDGQPIWLKDGTCYIVNNEFYIYGREEPCGINWQGKATSLFLICECGAYRRPPEDV